MTDYVRRLNNVLPNTGKLTIEEAVINFNFVMETNIVLKEIKELNHIDLKNQYDHIGIKKLYIKILYYSKKFKEDFIFGILLYFNCFVVQNKEEFTASCFRRKQDVHTNKTIKSNININILNVFTKKQKQEILKEFYYKTDESFSKTCLKVLFKTEINNCFLSMLNDETLWFYLVYNNKQLDPDHKVVQFLLTGETDILSTQDYSYNKVNLLDIEYLDNDIKTIMRNFINRIKNNDIIYRGL